MPHLSYSQLLRWNIHRQATYYIAGPLTDVALRIATKG